MNTLYKVNKVRKRHRRYKKDPNKSYRGEKYNA